MNTSLAHPSLKLAFFSGGSWFLPRLPLGPEFGLFLALTGHRLVGADAVHAGVATHFIPSSGLAAVRSEVTAALAAKSHWSCGDATAAISVVLNRHAAPLPHFTITGHQLKLLKKIFARTSAAEVAAELHAAAKAASSAEALQDAAFLGKSAKSLDQASPTSLRVTYEQLRRGAELPTLAACLAME